MKLRNLVIVLFSVLNISIYGQKLQLSYYTKTEVIGQSITQEEQSILDSRLQEIVMNYANGANNLTRFVLTGIMRIENSAVDEGLIPVWKVSGSFMFTISDVIENQKFTQVTIPFVGKGESESLAIKKAISSIKTDDNSLVSLFLTAENEITSFYSKRCQEILTQADGKVSINKHDEAIYMLTSFPFISQECNNKLLFKAGEIYMAKQNYECYTKLNEAKSKWATSQDLQTAACIGDILSTICHEACCFQEAEAFTNIISEEVKRLFNQNFNVNYELTVVNEQKRIEAARQVGIAYGKNQVSPIYTNHK